MHRCNHLNKNVNTFLLSVPSSGFGFYPSKDWEIFSSLRKRGGLGRGNYSDEDVCSMIGTYWDMQHPEDREEFCRPQWVGGWSGGQVTRTDDLTCYRTAWPPVSPALPSTPPRYFPALSSSTAVRECSFSTPAVSNKVCPQATSN